MELEIERVKMAGVQGIWTANSYNVRRMGSRRVAFPNLRFHQLLRIKGKDGFKIRKFVKIVDEVRE